MRENDSGHQVLRQAETSPIRNSTSWERRSESICHIPTARTRSIAQQAALTTGAVLGVLCIVATALSLAFGIKPVVFRSGSMSPAIPTGSLAFVKSQPVSELTVGDIVSVTTNGGDRLTHRVYGIDQLDNNLSSLTLKGDANNAPDSETYAVADADLVVFSMSRVGYVLAWLSGPIGIFAGGLFAGTLVDDRISSSTARRRSTERRHALKGIPNDTPTVPEHNSPRSRSTQVSSRILTAPWRPKGIDPRYSCRTGRTAGDVTDRQYRRHDHRHRNRKDRPVRHSPDLHMRELFAEPFCLQCSNHVDGARGGSLHLSCSGTQARRHHVQR